MAITPLVTGLPYRRHLFAFLAGLPIGLLTYRVVIKAVRRYLNRPSLLPKIMTDKFRGRFLQSIGCSSVMNVGLLQFYPTTLFVKGGHYADHRAGKDGFVRPDGWRENFAPVVNCLHEDVSDRLVLDFPLVDVDLPLYANYAIETERVDDESVITELRLKSLSFEPEHKLLDLLSFSSENELGRVFCKGVMTEEEPVVQMQFQPYVGCDLPLDVVENMRLRLGNKPNLGYMEYNIKKLGVENPGDVVPLLAKYLTTVYKPLKFEPVVISRSEGGSGGAVATIVDGTTFVYEPDQYGKILPNICTTDSVLLEANKAAEQLSYDERVKKYIHDETFDWPDDIKEYEEEFLNLITEGLEGSLRPCTHDEILEQQSRPTQLLSYLGTVLNCLDDEAQTETFQKGEVYPPKVSAPRIINNPPPQARVDTARFVKPMYDTLKATTMKFLIGFGNGMYVDECIERQVSIAKKLGVDLWETDGTKLDANINIKFRGLEHKLGRRLYHKDYQHEWDRVHLLQYSHRYPRTARGTLMDLICSRRSGEGGTSCFNTLGVSFLQYCERRRRGESVLEAWSNMGVCGGDDGLCAGIDPELFTKTALDLGIPHKLVRKTIYEDISFLGQTRVSAQLSLYTVDILRFVVKAAFSHVKNVPWEELAYRKMEPYVRYYSHVPLIGHYSRAVLRCLERRGFKGPSASYDELCRGVGGYYLSNFEPAIGTVQIGQLEVDLLEHYVADKLKVEVSVLRKFCQQLDEASDFSDFPTGLVNNDDVKVESHCVARGSYYTPEPEPKRNVQEEQIETKPRIAPGQNKPPQPNHESSETSSQATAASKRRKRRRKADASRSGAN